MTGTRRRSWSTSTTPSSRGWARSTSSTATTAPRTAFFYYFAPAYRPEAAMDGWEKIFTFFGTHPVLARYRA